MVVVLPDPRPSGNLPSGQRSGDSARADEPIVYCHERQRETLRLRKYPSGRTAGHVLLFQDLVGTMGDTERNGEKARDDGFWPRRGLGGLENARKRS